MQNSNVENKKKWWNDAKETDSVYASLAESEINQDNLEKKDQAMYNKLKKAKSSIISEMLQENDDIEWFDLKRGLKTLDKYLRIC